MDKIYFVGMMGSGKTTTAKELAKLRGLSDSAIVDLDKLIEEKEQKSINQIFSERGEDVFRGLETEVLRAVSNNSIHVMISTGGGAVLSRTNIDLMRRGKIIYLKTSFNVLWQRVKNSKTRPLIQGDMPEEKFRSIFDERTPVYEKIANYTVVTDGKTPGEVAKEINEKFFK